VNKLFLKYCFGVCLSIVLCSALAQAQSTRPASEQLLTVGGEVAHPLKLTTTELAKLPRVSVKAKDHDGKEANFDGVPLVEILKLAGVEFGERLRGKSLGNYLLAEAADGYRGLCVCPNWTPLSMIAS
jgi:hypothetical protein